MAKILVVDDRPLNRNFLVTLLGYYGHTLFEAADGVEAMAQVRERKPDLVITDLLMPNMDGEEFTRRLRADPVTKDMPVIIYTATYRAREAREIADRVGVRQILAKPSEPKLIIAAVAEALGTAAPAALPPAPGTSGAPEPEAVAPGKGAVEQLNTIQGLNFRFAQLLKSTMQIAKELANSLAAVRPLDEALQNVHSLSLRLTGLVELGLDLSQTRDPREMIELFCRALQDISSAHYAGVVVLGSEGEPLRQFAARGLDDATLARVAAEIAGCPAAKRVLVEGGACRLVIGVNPTDVTGLPASHPPVKNFLAYPVAAHDKTIGWLYVADRLGDESFSTDDEHIVMALASQFAIAWDGLAMYNGLERLLAERKRAEGALAASEKRLRTILDAEPECVKITTEEGILLDMNAAGLALIEADSLNQVVGRSICPLIAPAYRDAFVGFNRRVYHGESGTMEFEVIGLKGRQRWMSTHAVPLRDEHNATIGVLAITHDITERKRSEHNLVVSEQRYRRLFESAKDGILILDYETGHIVDVNPFLTTMLGFSYEEMLGKTLWDIGFARDRIDSKLNFDDLKRQGYVRYEDLPLETKDHRTFSVEFISNVYLVDKLNVIQCNIRDITERKRTKETLQKTHDQLTALIQAAPMGIAVLDPDGRVQLWNPAAERIFGWQEAEVLGHPMPTIPPDKQDEHRSFYRRVMDGHAFTGIDVVRQRKDGALVDISLSTAALKDEEGHVVGILGIMADITERKFMERRAVRQDELATLGQLMSGIAHELKNPLFVLSGRLQLVSEKLAAREYGTVGTDLKTIEDAAQRMTVITQRFLNFARPHTAQKERCAINLALKKTVDFLSNELMKSHIQLVMALGPNLQPVWCDPRDLQQIFTNLILNAIYAMAKANGRGTLTILTVPNEAAVEIRIQDDGSGIAPEHCVRLFDPFFTTKPADEGTGLGLWIVKSLIIGMYGTIDCESEIGKGTTFVVRLPTLPAQESS